MSKTNNERLQEIAEGMQELNEPTQLCTAEEFRDSSINGAFTVELGDYIADSGIDFWIYGHSHRNIKTRIGETNIVSNQLGYISHGEHLTNGFSFSAIIEV